MNTELLLKVKQHILAEPKRLDMEKWCKKLTPEEIQSLPNEYPQCGTIACIAGWTCVLGSSGAKFGGEVMYTAEELLNIPMHASYKLFYTQHWPEEFQQKYILAKTPQERAQVTAEVIDDFIRRYA